MKSGSAYRSSASVSRAPRLGSSSSNSAKETGSERGGSAASVVGRSRSRRWIAVLTIPGWTDVERATRPRVSISLARRTPAGRVTRHGRVVSQVPAPSPGEEGAAQLGACVRAKRPAGRRHERALDEVAHARRSRRPAERGARERARQRTARRHLALEIALARARLERVVEPSEPHRIRRHDDGGGGGAKEVKRGEAAHESVVSVVHGIEPLLEPRLAAPPAPAAPAAAQRHKARVQDEQLDSGAARRLAGSGGEARRGREPRQVEWRVGRND
mmetsp:Transcript_3236/g.10305  ORF Transcript_3236/g.10305 Transcript_3236/m.10305 type:complete len:273 (-) Transcript_3236:605-1423(-)